MPFDKIHIGEGNIICEGDEIAIISIGHIGNMIIEIINEFKSNDILIGHYDIRFLKPLDKKLLHQVFKKYTTILTIEDGCISGGMGAAILEFKNEYNYSQQIIRFGVPDRFIEHGSQKEQREECGYDKQSVINKLKELL